MVEERYARESAKLQALREAARVGFSDLEEDRAQTFSDAELEGTIAALGRQASRRG